MVYYYYCGVGVRASLIKAIGQRSKYCNSLVSFCVRQQLSAAPPSTGTTLRIGRADPREPRQPQCQKQGGAAEPGRCVRTNRCPPTPCVKWLDLSDGQAGLNVPMEEEMLTERGRGVSFSHIRTRSMRLLASSPPHKRSREILLNATATRTETMQSTRTAFNLTIQSIGTFFQIILSRALPIATLSSLITTLLVKFVTVVTSITHLRAMPQSGRRSPSCFLGCRQAGILRLGSCQFWATLIACLSLFLAGFAFWVSFDSVRLARWTALKEFTLLCRDEVTRLSRSLRIGQWGRRTERFLV